MIGITYLVVIVIALGRICGQRSLDALVVLQQARMRLLEVDERGCQPGGVVFKALALPEPVAHVCAWRQRHIRRSCLCQSRSFSLCGKRDAKAMGKNTA